jgi:hypothetical protein
MSSSQFDGLEALGIKRGGGAEPCCGPPEAFTILGLDITPERLAERYPDTSGKLAAAHERARKLIRGVRDRTRSDANDPPPDGFVAAVGAAGIVQRIIIANLGPDKKGKSWALIVAGRQRDWGARIWNKKAGPTEQIEMLAELRGFKNSATIDAELTTLDLNSASNVFVAMRPSQMADHAAMHSEAGRSDATIALRIGARDAEHVRLLLSLSKCSPEVQRQVDDNVLPLADCVNLALQAPEEQDRRVIRKTTGRGKNGKAAREAKDAAAPPRVHAVPAKILGAVADCFRDTDGRIATVLDWAAGKMKDPPQWIGEKIKMAKDAD